MGDKTKCMVCDDAVDWKECSIRVGGFWCPKCAELGYPYYLEEEFKQREKRKWEQVKEKLKPE